MLRYVYLHYLKDYDWILKADDDTYVIMENLRFLLSFNNPDLPGYLGYHFNMHLKPGYMSGGAGYVISRSYVIMENLRFLLSFNNPDLPGYLGYHFNMHLKQGYMSGGAGYVISRSGLKKVIEVAFKENGCPPDGKDEDLDIGKCLQMAGVPLLVSYNKYGHETFHTDKDWQHIYGTIPRYLKKYSWNGLSDGGGCCSQFSVTFNHVNPQSMLFDREEVAVASFLLHSTVLIHSLLFDREEGGGCCSQFSVTFHRVNPQSMLFDREEVAVASFLLHSTKLIHSLCYFYREEGGGCCSQFSVTIHHVNPVYDILQGGGCCSQFSVTFHHVNPQSMFFYGEKGGGCCSQFSVTFHHVNPCYVILQGGGWCSQFSVTFHYVNPQSMLFYREEVAVASFLLHSTMLIHSLCFFTGKRLL
ncbi:C1GALT1 [Mytilus coruscus]|uniref:N-acetylgalactosaminide beta-1,3-galactosyltransferase n=1 Tax=Mytilus coruscus TaxID=42192 RepID=A0A6J8CQ16_MYTCO|nr:C1GALT1 [Mytilus coruscus]